MSCEYCGAPSKNEPQVDYGKLFVTCNLSLISLGEAAKKLGVTKKFLLEKEPRFIILDRDKD